MVWNFQDGAIQTKNPFRLAVSKNFVKESEDNYS